jgi:hypothetical protein
LAAVQYLPVPMILRSRPQKQKCRALLPENFALNPFERQPAVEHSPFELAEHPQLRRETDSEWSRRLPEPEFQVGQLGSSVAMKQQPEAMPKCLGFESPHVAGLPLVKRPARLPEHQFALAFGCHEPTWRLSRGKLRAQLLPQATAERQPPLPFAPGV